MKKFEGENANTEATNIDAENTSVASFAVSSEEFTETELAEVIETSDAVEVPNEKALKKAEKEKLREEKKLKKLAKKQKPEDAAEAAAPEQAAAEAAPVAEAEAPATVAVPEEAELPELPDIPVSPENAEKVQRFSAAVSTIKKELSKDVVGMEDIVDNVLCAIVAGGNVLLEGVPGVGKTRLVRALGKTMSLSFSRIQFTPDLMPSDVTGTNIIEKDESGKMNTVFQRGPIFANLVLADEINRATPKTQSAMLEVMQEHKVTVAKQTYRLAEPFFVLATQNPIEQDGTYPLPEAQMDRFMFKLIVNFPSAKDLADIVNMTQITLEETANSVIDGATIMEMRELAKSVPVIDAVLDWTVNLVSNTHPELDKTSATAKKYIRYGASPRAAQALITCAKVRALMNGKFNVSYNDIKALAYPVLRHRIKLNYSAISDKLTVDDVIKQLISETK